MDYPGLLVELLVDMLLEMYLIWLMQVRMMKNFPVIRNVFNLADADDDCQDPKNL